MLKTRGGFFVAAHTIRYRQPVMMFSTYKVLTRPIWWDKKYIYYDHRIITLADGVIRSIGYSKSCCDSFDVEEFINGIHPGVDKPQMPDDMVKWLEFNKASSDRMKRCLTEKETESTCKSKQG
ncbi:Protein THEM6 [Orchesella cincta]|uniref:Protein THEM6 n=1 Tax=Orchesella cincta TaxID=48709 RepID=A0A1D2MU50_ORCCI|nr:Protein THEM6 [Orchesella cincta]